LKGLIMAACIGGWLCIALIAVLSLLPADDLVRTSVGGYAEHAIAYAGTALLLSFGYRAPLRVGLALFVYAGSLELLQALSPDRHPGLDGWAASSVGVLIGVAAASWLARLPVGAQR
jgi:hypothetical protein